MKHSRKPAKGNIIRTCLFVRLPMHRCTEATSSTCQLVNVAFAHPLLTIFHFHCNLKTMERSSTQYMASHMLQGSPWYMAHRARRISEGVYNACQQTNHASSSTSSNQIQFALPASLRALLALAATLHYTCSLHLLITPANYTCSLHLLITPAHYTF
jgi:hypothetical protein